MDLISFFFFYLIEPSIDYLLDLIYFQYQQLGVWRVIAQAITVSSVLSHSWLFSIDDKNGTHGPLHAILPEKIKLVVSVMMFHEIYGYVQCPRPSTCSHWPIHTVFQAAYVKFCPHTLDVSNTIVSFLFFSKYRFEITLLLKIVLLIVNCIDID